MQPSAPNATIHRIAAPPCSSSSTANSGNHTGSALRFSHQVLTALMPAFARTSKPGTKAFTLSPTAPSYFGAPTASPAFFNSDQYPDHAAAESKPIPTPLCKMPSLNISFSFTCTWASSIRNTAHRCSPISAPACNHPTAPRHHIQPPRRLKLFLYTSIPHPYIHMANQLQNQNSCTELGTSSSQVPNSPKPNRSL